MERWEKESFPSADFFFVSRSVVCTCKLQKGKEGKKRKKVNLRGFIACKGTALQKQSLVHLSGSVVRARLCCGSREGRKASETPTRLPAIGGGDVYSTRLWARLTPAVTWAVSWTGWQFFWCTMSRGRKLRPLKVLDHEASVFQHTRGWITHAKPPPEGCTVPPPQLSLLIRPDWDLLFSWQPYLWFPTLYSYFL